MYFEKEGEVRDKHEHTFDHVMAIWTGGIRVEIETPDGHRHPDSGDYYAPDMKGLYARPCLVNIRKECKHKLTSLRERTHAGCLYFHRDPDTGEPVEEFNGWMQAAT
jgi:hypothetical protein